MFIRVEARRITVVGNEDIHTSRDLHIKQKYRLITSSLQSTSITLPVHDQIPSAHTDDAQPSSGNHSPSQPSLLPSQTTSSSQVPNSSLQNHTSSTGTPETRNPQHTSTPPLIRTTLRTCRSCQVQRPTYLASHHLTVLPYPNDYCFQPPQMG